MKTSWHLSYWSGPDPRLPSLLHNFATLEHWLIYQCPSSWPVVITMKKKLAGTWKNNRILASPNSWQQVCNWSNLEESGRSCEGLDFSWLSLKVSWTLLPSLLCGPGPALPAANRGRWWALGASMARVHSALGSIERPSDRGAHSGAVNEPCVVASMVHPSRWSTKVHPRALVVLGVGGQGWCLPPRRVGLWPSCLITGTLALGFCWARWLGRLGG
jgi:hypothetical protein